jgi:Flp pilus assembly pilin Flp
MERFIQSKRSAAPIEVALIAAAVGLVLLGYFFT